MLHSGVPGTPGSPETPISLPSRRELRAQREAAEAQADATVSAPVTADGSVEIPVVEAVAIDLDVATIVARTSRLNPVEPPKAPRGVSRPVRTSRVRRPLKIAVTLLAIPGLFLTAGLPAYAFAPGSDVSSNSARVAEAQGATVAGGTAAITVARDGFTATTSEELAQRDADALSAKQAEEAAATVTRSASAEFAVYTVRAEGDDYPWFDQATDNQGGGLSPLGYYYRECVDFVAWRLNRDAGSTGSPWSYTWSSLTPSGGNASNWASAWADHGWATGNAPVVGAVAWFNYNHVAYVQSVNSDGSVVLEEYNWNSSHAYHTRTVSPSEVPLFLYPPA